MDFTDSDFDFEIAFQPAAVEEPEPDHPGHKLGLFSGISNGAYHSGPGISSSSLKYAAKALRLYKSAQDGEVGFEETEDMVLGTAVHKLILEPHDFGGDVIVFKKPNLRTNAGRQKRDEFYAEHKGKIILTPERYDQCRYMRDSLQQNPEVKETGIFDSGQPELSGYYQDRSEHGAGTYMLCKYRPDWRSDWGIADVKSTRDASKAAFSKTINSLGYHISAAHYLAGDAQLTGTTHRQFIFLCVEKEPPFLSAVYVLGDKSLELGDKIRRRALDEIKRARNTGVWRGLNQDRAQVVDVPGYAFYDEDI